MIYFLTIALGYLLITSFILGVNYIDFTPLLTFESNKNNASYPMVSICIPARNEEAVIERAIQSLLSQNYPNFEIIVLDDQSTDATQEIISGLKKDNPEYIKIIAGKPKPDNWLGKSWACHQLNEAASGERLLFIDADVWLEPTAVGRIVQSMKHHAVDFITVWPLQRVATFWETVVIPIIYYGLLSLLPARYVHRYPRWLPSSLKKRLAPRFAAACGQCLAFKIETYRQIGGHESVKNDVVEDVALARQIKSNGYTMRMYHGEDAAHCRMYTSGAEMWQGFRKNFLALYNNSIPAFIFMALLNFVVYVLPFVLLPFALWSGNSLNIALSSTAIGLIFLHRLLLSRWYSFSVAASFTHPLGVLWFHALGIRVLVDYFKGHAPEWKGRST